MSSSVSRTEAISLLQKLRDDQSPTTLICVGPGNQRVVIGGYVTSVSEDLLAVERVNQMAVGLTIQDSSFAFTDPREAWEGVRDAAAEKYDYALEFRVPEWRCFI